MIQIIVAIVMWMLVASLLILRRGRAERSITYSAVTIAVAMTLNIDAVYDRVDQLLGGANLATLLADLALMFGIFFLGRGVVKVTEYRSRAVNIALGGILLAVSLTGVIVAFALIKRGETTTTFMLDYGAQPAAAAYSMIEYAYNGMVVTVMAVVSARRIGQSTGVDRLPAISLLLGSLCGLVLSAVIIVMDLAHVSGNVPLMVALGAVYGPLFLLTFVLLCFGLASLPAIRRVHARSRALTTRRLVTAVTPAWERARQVRPSVGEQDLGAFTSENPDAMLHRQIVEIRDAVFDPRVSFTLSASERELVDQAEAHLTGQPVRTPPNRPRPGVGQPKEAR
ncbi:hypothetical protein [Microbacterium mangrovi]|uniref:hypothetical protein n=1 Tax=Microbacterium mangrovi TaxID=1348253 RepID=UPI000A4DAEA8|nr:hypothetical protein [Microbacterium mangrovi]